ncbi:hypothetical protein BVX98_01330 [bacterium F11]|nr:hypothetical protein BVX98_01330 [bacterium F11]
MISVFLIFIIILALLLRVIGLDHGLPFIYSDLEPHVLYIVGQFDVTGFNPQYFVKPTFLMYLLYGFFKLFQVFYFWGPAPTSSFDPSLVFMGRLFCAVLSTGGVLLVYALGREAFSSKRVGLVASFFLSVSLLDVFNAHYILTDAPMLFFLILGLLFCVRVAQGADWKNYLYAAGSIGLSAGSKYPGGVLLLILVVAHLLRPFSEQDQKKTWKKKLTLKTWPILAMTGAVGFFFLLTSPYFLLDHKKGIEGIKMIWGYVSRPHFFLRFYSPWKSYLFEALGFGLGWPILLAGFFGVGLSIYKKNRIGILLGVTVIVFFLIISVKNVFYYRYALPLLAPLCVLAAWSLDQFKEYRPSWRSLYFLLIIFLAVLPLSRSLRMVWLFTQPDTRSQGLEWVETHIPEGSRILHEYRYDLYLGLHPDQWPDLEEASETATLLWKGMHQYRLYRSKRGRVPYRSQNLTGGLHIRHIGKVRKHKIFKAEDVRREGTEFVVFNHVFLSRNTGWQPLELLKLVRKGELLYHNSPYTGDAPLPVSRWERIPDSQLSQWASTPWEKIVPQHHVFPWRDIWRRNKMGPALWIYDVRKI